jgi:basic membrane protein A
MNDGGWNAAAYRGLMALKDQGYDVAFTENVEISSIEETLHNYAGNNFDLVIGHGFECGEPVMRVSGNYPRVRFFVSGKMPDGVDEADIPANVGFMDMKEYEAAYLAGIVAGGMTTSNIIGYVAGMEIPSQLADMSGFVRGVAAANPRAKVYGVITGTFEDPATGKEAALAQIDLGADIIAQSADSTGIGVFEAVAERPGVNLIGYGADQYEMLPDRVITCFITDNPSAIKLQAKRIEDGSFGGLWSPGIADGICFISPYHNFESKIPQHIKEQVETAIKDMSSGELVVPAIYERIDEKLK